MPTLITRKNGKEYKYEVPPEKIQEYRRNSTIPNKRGQAKRHADKKGMPFTLTTKYLKELWDTQGGLCALTGVALGSIGDGYNSPSIDRIDNALGYVEGNVWWVCWRANEAKKDMLLEDFLLMCEAITERATTIPRGSTPKQVEAQDNLLKLMI